MALCLGMTHPNHMAAFVWTSFTACSAIYCVLVMNSSVKLSLSLQT